MKYDDTARLKEQVGLLISALGSDHPATVHSSEAQLSLIGKPAVPLLLSALQNSHAEIEDLNKERKERYGSDSYEAGRRRPELERITKGIIKTLGIIGDSSTVSVLAQELPDPSAIEALSKISNEEALNAIINCIPKLKLWHDGYTPVEKDGDLFEDDQEFLINLFSELGEDGLKALIDASQTDSPGKSRYQIVLSLIATEKEIPLLMDVLNRGQPTVAYFALKRLRELKAKSAAPKLKELIMKDKVKDGKRSDESESRLYREAIWAIHDLGTVNDWLDIRFAKKDHPVIEILESPKSPSISQEDD